MAAPSHQPSGRIISANASLSAAAQASVWGKLGRLEISDTIYGLLFSFMSCAGLYGGYHGAQYSGWFVLLGLFGLVCLFINRVVQSWRNPAGPVDFNAIASNTGWQVSTTVADGRLTVRQLTQHVLGRKQLPPPDGEVLGGRVQDSKSVRPYTEEEKRVQGELQQLQVEEHDQRLFEEAVARLRQQTQGLSRSEEDPAA